MTLLIVMYILKCLDIIQTLIISQMEVDTFKDLYKQMIVVSARDTFPARVLNIFVNYPLGSMKVGDKLCTNWNNSPM